MALVFSGVAVISAAIRLMTRSGSDGLVVLFLTQTLVLYLSGAVVCGALVGLLRPLGKTWLGVALIGFVAGLPISAAGFGMFLGLAAMTRPVIILSVVLAAIWGLGAAIVMPRDT